MTATATATADLAHWAGAARMSINYTLARDVATKSLRHPDPEVREAARALIAGLNSREQNR